MIDKIETYIISHYSDSDFMDKYKKFIKENYPNPITEPLLGDEHLTELTNRIISGTELTKDSFDYLKQSDIVLDDNDELSHEMLSLARDIPTFSIDTLKETINKYQNLTATNPEYSELYVEIVGPSADELVNTLCDEHRAGDLDSVTQDMYPRAFSELYDDDWYQRLKPETIMKLMRERGDDFSGYVNLNKAKKVADNVAGIVTGNRAMNTINKVKNDIHDTIDKYNPSDSGSKVKPQGATGGDYSESENPSDKLIQKMKDKGLENRPPLEDKSNKSIPTGDKPDEYLGGNPNDKSEGNTDMALQQEVTMQAENPETGEVKNVHAIVDPSAPALVVDRIIKRYVKDVSNKARPSDSCSKTDFASDIASKIDDVAKSSGQVLDKAAAGEYGKTYKFAAESLNNALSTMRNSTRRKQASEKVWGAVTNPVGAIYAHHLDKKDAKAEADAKAAKDEEERKTQEAAQLAEQEEARKKKNAASAEKRRATIARKKKEAESASDLESTTPQQTDTKPTDPKPASEIDFEHMDQSFENII